MMNIFLCDLHAAVGIENQIFVRDYKTYRIYSQGVNLLSINKISKNGSFVFLKNKTVMSVSSAGNKKIIEYMVPSKEKRHYVVYKIEKNKKSAIGYYSNNRQIYFSENEPKDLEKKQSASICERPINRSISDIQKIAKSIMDTNALNSIELVSDDDATSILDVGTCKSGDARSDLLKKSLRNFFNDSGNGVIKCLQSVEAQKKMAKDNALLNQANIFVTRMVGFVDEIKLAQINKSILSNGVSDKLKNNFKIKCESTAAMQGKVACFSDQYENPTMSIDLDKIPKQSDGNLDVNKLNAYLLHEFLHAGTQQPETSGPQKNCLDEMIVESLQNICGDKVQTKTTQDLAQKCMQADTSIKKEISLGAEAAVNTANEAAQRAPASAPENLIPTQTQISQLANATLPQIAGPTLAANYSEGQKVPVTDPATLREVSNTFSNLNSMTTGMGTVMKAAAAAAVGTIAVASTSSASRSPTNNVPASSSAYVPYPPSEIIADKYSSGAPATTNGTISSLANNAAAAPVTGNNFDLNSKNTAVTKTAIGGSQGSVEPPTGAPTTSADSPIATLAPSDSATGSRKIASVAANRNSDISTAASTNEKPQWATRAQLVENLKIRKTFTGKDYAEIKKYYADPNFKNQLQTLGISIELRTTNTNQKLRSIGADANTKIKFVDDGQNLIRQK